MWRRGGRWTRAILAILTGVGLAWCGWRLWDVRRERYAMARIEEAMQTGRYGAAARDLSAQLARGRDPGRIAYLLGVCERARGRGDEAEAAWSRIPPDSPFAGRAILGRVELLIECGQLADAEALIQSASQARGPEGTALWMLLIPVLMQEGRRAEAERIIEARWRHLDERGEGPYEQGLNLARLHMELRWNDPPVDEVRAYLDRAGGLAPDDDRIWLGRANLAIRVGALEEAAHWIESCLERRPEDRAVWRARLDWAVKSNRLPDARTALAHLQADAGSPAELHRLSAWMAAACGDVEGERREIAALLDEAPEDFAALERLQSLEPSNKAEKRVSELEQRRAEIDRHQARYRALYQRNQPARDAEEMARLAERLGHRFEATVFLTAALAEEPDRVDLRAALHRLKADVLLPASKPRSLER